LPKGAVRPRRLTLRIELLAEPDARLSRSPPIPDRQEPLDGLPVHRDAVGSADGAGPTANAGGPRQPGRPPRMVAGEQREGPEAESGDKALVNPNPSPVRNVGGPPATGAPRARSVRASDPGPDGASSRAAIGARQNLEPTTAAACTSDRWISGRRSSRADTTA